MEWKKKSPKCPYCEHEPVDSEQMLELGLYPAIDTCDSEEVKVKCPHCEQCYMVLVTCHYRYETMEETTYHECGGF